MNSSQAQTLKGIKPSKGIIIFNLNSNEEPGGSGQEKQD